MPEAATEVVVESCNENANCVDSFLALALDSFVLLLRLEDVPAVEAEVESCHETASCFGPFELHRDLALDSFVLFLRVQDLPVAEAEEEGESCDETASCFGEIYREDVLRSVHSTAMNNVLLLFRHRYDLLFLLKTLLYRDLFRRDSYFYCVLLLNRKCHHAKWTCILE